MTEVSATRIFALRIFYLLSLVGGAFTFWPPLLNPDQPLGLFDGVAFSFWASLMALMGLGVRSPLQMLPLVLLQLCYKTVWLLAVALPLRSAGQWDATTAQTAATFAFVAALDVVVIPWRYVLANYVKTPGLRLSPS
jgi:hypothetical protein